jgi:hypothetical protein
MTKDNYNLTDKELEELMNQQDYAEDKDFDYWEERDTCDRYSIHNCSHCGARLTIDEWEEFEDTCEECLFSQVPMLDDDVEKELK